MAHYAKVENGVVTQVIVADQEFIDSAVLGHDWVQTSYNTGGAGDNQAAGGLGRGRAGGYNPAQHAGISGTTNTGRVVGLMDILANGFKIRAAGN